MVDLPLMVYRGLCRLYSQTQKQLIHMLLLTSYILSNIECRSWLKMKMLQCIIGNYREMVTKHKFHFLWTTEGRISLPYWTQLTSWFSVFWTCSLCRANDHCPSGKMYMIDWRLLRACRMLETSVYETFVFVALSLFLWPEMGTDSQVAGRPGLPVRMLWSVAEITQSWSKHWLIVCQVGVFGMFEPKGQRESLLAVVDQTCT